MTTKTTYAVFRPDETSVNSTNKANLEEHNQPNYLVKNTQGNVKLCSNSERGKRIARSVAAFIDGDL